MEEIGEKRLLIVEDDAVFARTLARSFERRGYRAVIVADPDELDQVIAETRPNHAVVDLKLGPRSGLACVRVLHAFDPEMRIVVLTGYASIATAIEAIKLGASHYLPKPSATDDIEAAFERLEGDADAPIRSTPLKAWENERINQTLAETGFNISETARRLGLHRRTLARKLAKRPFK